MEYDFRKIEAEWKKYWNDKEVYKVHNDSDKPKCYVLDMFPYPSGAGLHVGHPLGYIASDIYARYKRQKGFNVLHPMGFDAFGLPAEQYAIETGQHPAVTTEKNIARYREQLDNIGFSYDWSRAVRTSDPSYYKWTQWIFLQLFHSWYNHKENKARPISELIAIFEKEGNTNVPCPGDETLKFDSETWRDLSEKDQRAHLMQYRLAYQGYAQVWWCEALGTVLANDEVVNGVSERGGHPVERKNMRQWFLRITEYADRLLASLDTLDWTEAMKEMQRNWIGKSNGAEVRFDLYSRKDNVIRNSTKSLTPTLSFGEGDVDAENESNSLAWQTADLEVYDQISTFQNNLKNNLTEAENILWQNIRNNKLNVKFRRQHIVGKFIVDFICLPCKLIVEVDGKIHKKQAIEDAARTEYLNERGFKVIRFLNEEIIADVKTVLEKIKKHISEPGETQENRSAGEHKVHNISFGEDRDEAQNMDDANEGHQLRNISLSFGEGRGEAQNMDDTNEEHQLRNTSLSFGEGRGEAQNMDDANVGHQLRNTSLSFGEGRGEVFLTVFTTRPDTIFGVDFMVLAPEHELVNTITTPEQKNAIEEYKTYVKSRSERERMSEVKQVTGCFTGAYAIHPLTQKQIPVWISEYVLAGYGTGAIMGVPSGDERDHAFAKHFNIPITNIFGDKYNGEKAYSDKTGTIENSDFLSGKKIPDATEAAINALVEAGVGKRKVNFRLRDAGFSRQRYWGEPFPIMYMDDIPYGIDEPIIHNDWNLGNLPVELPMVAHYKPGPEGKGPLANIEDWVTTEAGQRETNTMPGYAGSSWYFLRYADPHNDSEFASRKATDYWNQVDLYIGGTEHAVGHLLYSRMWTKALYDLGHISFDEPFKKLLNQGMIQGSTRFMYRVNDTNTFVSSGLKKEYNTTPLRVDVNIVDGVELDTEAFKKWRPEYADAAFILEDGKYICSAEVEKMSKSKYNVVNPDDIVAQYGADTFRMYEMFLGPIDISKPWDTKGIEGVHRFLKKMWRLYFDDKGLIVTDDTPTDAELRALHKTIKKIGEDIERFSFNTSVSQFMICVNELTTLGCHKRAILEPLTLSICPFAPHIAEELWHQLGRQDTVITAAFPDYEERYVTDNTKKYPVAVNGKTRIEMEFPLDAEEATVRQQVLADETIQKWLEGKEPKKFIYVKGKMINVVV